MSNILKNSDELIALADIIKYVRNHDLDISYINEVLKLLSPSNVDSYVTQKGRYIAAFIPQYTCIKTSVDNINNWLDINVKDIDEIYDVKDINMLKSYLFLFLITHEIEHSYQYLMARGIVEVPSRIIKYGYRGIYDLLLKSESIIPRPIKEMKTFLS